MKKKKITLILMLVLLTSFLFASSFDTHAVLQKYSEEDIRKFFQESRRYEFIDDYHEKDEGVFVLTTKGYYQIGINKDDSIRLKFVKTRKEYDSVVVG